MASTNNLFCDVDFWMYCSADGYLAVVEESTSCFTIIRDAVNYFYFFVSRLARVFRCSSQLSRSLLLFQQCFRFPCPFLAILPEIDSLHTCIFLVSLLPSILPILYLSLSTWNFIAMLRGAQPISPNSPAIGHTLKKSHSTILDT